MRILCLVPLLVWAAESEAGFTAGVDDPKTYVNQLKGYRVSWEPIQSYEEEEQRLRAAQAAPNAGLGDQCPGGKPCKPGLVLPVWEPATGISWPTRLFRALVYLLALVYLFMGISIVADRFMAAIEVITSQEREVVVKKVNGERATILVRVWNETVSNLTLMALGSSAPEIMLSVIEIAGNGFEAGDLGPGTIVGSAAFNLFIIIAVCIVSVPAGEVRRVERNDVFYVTVVWSTFAYIWLYLILAVFSPNVVEVWEGVLTFIFFAFTVINAYIANRYAPALGKRFFRKGPTGFRSHSMHHHGSMARSPKSSTIEPVADLEAASHLVEEERNEDVDAFLEHRQRFYDIFTEMRAKHPDMPLQQIAQLTALKTLKKEPKSRAFRRIQATRRMVGQKLKRNDVDMLALIPSVTTSTLMDPSAEADDTTPVTSSNPEVSVSFRPCHLICVEDCGAVNVTAVVDRGSIKAPCVVEVKYRTIEGSAKAEDDFVPVQGILFFDDFETKKDISIKIVDRDDYENDEEFYVQLYEPRAYHKDNDQMVFPSKVGLAFEATVIIIDDDHGGSFTFKSEVLKLRENCGYAYLTVHRTRGARGQVSLPYKVTDGKAKKGEDYECDDGVLVFEDKQTTADIRIRIINDLEYEKNEDFYIQLEAPVWHKENQVGQDGADGRPVLGDHNRCKVVVVEDDKVKGFLDGAMKTTTSNILVGTSSWRQQFEDAVAPPTAEEDEDECEDEEKVAKESRPPTTMQKVLHYLNMPWRVLFATIPPTDYINGWLCFVVSVVFIGLLTAVVGDVAAMFGCTIGLKDVVTAITLVAVGTSVPDMFASRLATVQDPSADAAVGNVTGSNAVNVFLGIGLAWALAALVHWWRGTVFRVAAGSLATSLTTFLAGSLVCLALLAWRRRHPAILAELGGPEGPKKMAAGVFVLVWLVYLAINSLSAYCMLPF